MVTNIVKPVPVKLFCGVLLSEGVDSTSLVNVLCGKFGSIDHRSEMVDFSRFSNYYENEMGANIVRYFLSFDACIDRTVLPDIKNATIEIEKEFSINGKRTCNLDPGYLTLGQVFLASTKDNFCRIYIRDGIYEEVTLRFVKDTYTPFPYTYKDYRSSEYTSFFNVVRRRYKEQFVR